MPVEFFERLVELLKSPRQKRREHLRRSAGYFSELDLGDDATPAVRARFVGRRVAERLLDLLKAMAAGTPEPPWEPEAILFELSVGLNLLGSDARDGINRRRSRATHALWRVLRHAGTQRADHEAVGIVREALQVFVHGRPPAAFLGTIGGEAYKVLGAALALDRFTVASIAEWTGVNPTTIRTVLRRYGGWIENVGTGRGRSARGGRIKYYRVAPRSRGAIERKLSSVFRDLRPDPPRPTEPGRIPSDLIDLASLLIYRWPQARDEEDRGEVLELAADEIRDAQRLARDEAPRDLRLLEALYEERRAPSGAGVAEALVTALEHLWGVTVADEAPADVTSSSTSGIADALQRIERRLDALDRTAGRIANDTKVVSSTVLSLVLRIQQLAVRVASIEGTLSGNPPESLAEMEETMRTNLDPLPAAH